MDNVFFMAALACIAGVAAALFMGLFAMSQEGDKSRKMSNKMMRLRVTLQGLAIVFLFLAYITKG